MFVAKREPRKGLDTLLLALRGVTWPWLLTVGGEGWADELSIVRLAAEFPQDRVRFVGRIDNGDLCAEFHQHDLVVVPSHYENFGNVSVEAQAAGLPVLASHTGGLADSVMEGRTGFLFDPMNPGDLKAKLDVAFACGRGGLREMGAIARSTAVALYDWSSISEAYESVLTAPVDLFSSR